MHAMLYPTDKVEPEAGDGVDDDAALMLALRGGPLGYGIPVVSEAMRYTRHAVGGPLWDALSAAVAAGRVRILTIAESDARGLPFQGWPFCEDVR